MLYKIRGKSMLPVFHDGDIVELIQIAKPNVGDYVVFKCPYNFNFAIKQVAKVHNNSFWATSLNSGMAGYLYADSTEFGWLENDRIIGKVVRTWKKPKLRLTKSKRKLRLVK